VLLCVRGIATHTQHKGSKVFYQLSNSPPLTSTIEKNLFVDEIPGSN
jgi:hypothetical protein